jgi:hypothetical protein
VAGLACSLLGWVAGIYERLMRPCAHVFQVASCGPVECVPIRQWTENYL